MEVVVERHAGRCSLEGTRSLNDEDARLFRLKKTRSWKKRLMHDVEIDWARKSVLSVSLRREVSDFFLCTVHLVERQIN